MLKLEKISRREISISVRDRKNRFDRIFLQAVGIAIALHLVALLVFQIQPFIVIGDKILAPSLVESDIDFGSNDIVAEIEREGIPQRDLLEPKLSLPMLPEMPISGLERSLEYKENSLMINPFIEIAEDWEYLANDGKPSPAPRSIQVHISGELAEIPLISDGATFSVNKEHFHASYAVQVEGKTGHIFWYMPTPNSKTNAMAEKILNEIGFQPNPNAFVYSGEIEITL